MKLIGAGPAPSALNSEVRSGAAGTRILKPLRSSGVLISRPDEVIWRKPLSHTLRHRHDRRLGDLRADIGAEIAVHRLPHRVVVGEGEARVHDARGRHERGEDRGRQVEELDAAIADLRQQIGVRTELVGRKQLDFEPAAGRLADAIERLLGADVDRMRRVLSRCELVLNSAAAAGRVSMPHKRHGRARQEQTCGE